MENASKALLMAAAVLISGVVLTLAFYLYASFSDAHKENVEQMYQTQIAGFNSKFTSYDGKSDLTYYDIINVANLAIENNKSNNNDKSLYISVNIDGKDLTKDSNYNSYVISSHENLKNEEKGIMENVTKEGISSDEENVLALKKYTCKVSLNQDTGRVYKIVFSETR